MSNALSDFSASEMFQSGNYASVALRGSRENWETFAALGLIGKTESAILGLNQFQDEEALFYLGVTYWIGGNEEEALSILEKVHTPHAQNLIALIRKKQISVLAQLPWTRAGSWDLITAAQEDEKFKVNNISFHSEDLLNQPYADVHQYYEHPPDFYICQMVEWHLIPPNLRELPCPIFGQTGDYDLHIQAVYPWLQIFDEILVTDQSEWQDVTRLVQVPVSTFPKSFCLPNNLPSLQAKTREFDLFMSGTVNHPFHPDKAQLLYQILQIPDVKMKIVNGFMQEETYYKNLANTKVCYTYIRHPSALPTRGLEALSMGAALVVQEDSVLTIFVEEEQGVLTYELEKNNLGIQIKRITENWFEFEHRAKKGAEIIRQEFSAPKVASQYLRFLTFLAAKPRKQRPRQNTEQLYQKRTILQKGWLPSYDFLNSPILKQIGIANYTKLRETDGIKQISSCYYIDLARESVLYNYHLAQHQRIPVQEWLESLIKIYRRGISLFPKSLILRFNFIRVILHFGEPSQVSDALKLTQETLDLPGNYWHLHLMEDVFPWDFCPHYFNYRKYFDLVTSGLKEKQIYNPELCNTILASLYYYKGLYADYYQGFYCQSIDDFRKAIKLDPDFPYYKYQYAQKIIDRGLPEDYREAEEILINLSSSSISFSQLLDLAQKLQASKKYLVKNTQKIQFIYKQGKSLVKSIENFPEVSLKPQQSENQLQAASNKNQFSDLTQLTLPPKEVLKSFFDVVDSDIEGYNPRPNITKEELLERIRAMESSKFWQLGSYLSKINLTTKASEKYHHQYASKQDVTKEELLGIIQDMESSAFWQVRVYWFTMKLVLGNFLRRLKSNI